MKRIQQKLNWIHFQLAVTSQRASDSFWRYLLCPAVSLFLKKLCDGATCPFLCDCCVNSLLMFARLTFRAKKINLSMWSERPSAHQWRGVNVCASLTQSMTCITSVPEHLRSELSKQWRLHKSLQGLLLSSAECWIPAVVSDLSRSW